MSKELEIINDAFFMNLSLLHDFLLACLSYRSNGSTVKTDIDVKLDFRSTLALLFYIHSIIITTTRETITTMEVGVKIRNALVCGTCLELTRTYKQVMTYKRIDFIVPRLLNDCIISLSKVKTLHNI